MPRCPSLQWDDRARTRWCLASFLMLAGFDRPTRLGRRRTFQVGPWASFGLGLAAVQPGADRGLAEIAARALQAIGGFRCSTPVAMSIITNTFTDRVERAKAIGAWWGWRAGARPPGPGPVVGAARWWTLRGLAVGSSGSMVADRGSRPIRGNTAIFVPRVEGRAGPAGSTRSARGLVIPGGWGTRRLREYTRHPASAGRSDRGRLATVRGSRWWRW